MKAVKAKKHLGQHFLVDKNIAAKIVEAIDSDVHFDKILEIGPGMGVLSESLRDIYKEKFFLSEIDKESVLYLKEELHFPATSIIEGDFLKMNLNEISEGKKLAIIGNFPYNISSQIFFKVLEYEDAVPIVVGMIQKEVAERIASKHGNKTYGITSVLLQAFYDIEYLFTVHEHVFQPAPKVKSAVIRLKRNDKKDIGCDKKLFFKVVKQAFNTRRKTLRNALKSFDLPIEFTETALFNQRAEQLSVQDFIELTATIQTIRNNAV